VIEISSEDPKEPLTEERQHDLWLAISVPFHRSEGRCALPELCRRILNEVVHTPPSKALAPTPTSDSYPFLPDRGPEELGAIAMRTVPLPVRPEKWLFDIEYPKAPQHHNMQRLHPKS
jgi:hypothetical protein